VNERGDRIRGNDPANADIVPMLVENHRRFRSFLERRVRDPATADDLLQNAYVKGIEKSAGLREGESAVAWFYRLLRNAVVDAARRVGAERRALERRGRETAYEIDEAELRGEICRCVAALLPTLKEEDAELLRRVDLEGREPAAVAAGLGVAAGTLRVRLHRARKALRRLLEHSCGTCTEHGCLDCSCKPRETPPFSDSR
jgi:RNA polymerase sigma factor (sigma-70 family)